MNPTEPAGSPKAPQSTDRPQQRRRCVVSSLLSAIAGITAGWAICFCQHGCARVGRVQNIYGDNAMNAKSISFDPQEMISLDASDVPADRRREVLENFERDVRRDIPSPDKKFKTVQFEPDKAAGGAFTVVVRAVPDEYYVFLINRSLPSDESEYDRIIRWHCWFGVAWIDGPLLQPHSPVFDDMIGNVMKKAVSARVRALLKNDIPDGSTDPHAFYRKLRVTVAGEEVTPGGP